MDSEKAKKKKALNIRKFPIIILSYWKRDGKLVFP